MTAQPIHRVPPVGPAQSGTDQTTSFMRLLLAEDISAAKLMFGVLARRRQKRCD
jgi:hypothetical protein